MRRSRLAVGVAGVTVAGVTSAVAFGLLYGTQASSQSKSIDLAVYTPIGVAQTPAGTHSVAWVLDATNRRVVMCSQKLNDSAARIECRSGALPTD